MDPSQNKPDQDDQQEVHHVLVHQPPQESDPGSSSSSSTSDEETPEQGLRHLFSQPLDHPEIEQFRSRTGSAPQLREIVLQDADQVPRGLLYVGRQPERRSSKKSSRQSSRRSSRSRSRHRVEVEDIGSDNEADQISNMADQRQGPPDKSGHVRKLEVNMTEVTTPDSHRGETRGTAAPTSEQLRDQLLQQSQHHNLELKQQMKDILSQSQHQQEMFKQTLEAMQTMITKGHDPEARPRRSSMSRPRSPAPRARSPDKNDVGSKHRSPSTNRTEYIDRYLSQTDLTKLKSDDDEKAGIYPILKGMTVAQKAALENSRSNKKASLKAVPPDAKLAQSLMDERNYVRRTVADPILDSMQIYQRYHEVGDALYPDQLAIDLLDPTWMEPMASRDFEALIKRYRPKELFETPSKQFATLLQKICTEQNKKLTDDQVQELVNACCGGEMSRVVLLIFEGYDINDALNEIYKRFGNIPHRYDLENALLDFKISAKNFCRDMDKYEHAMRESRKSCGLSGRNIDSELIHECRSMLPKDFRRKALEMIHHYQEQERRGHPPLTWLHFRDTLIKFGRDNNHFPA